MEHEKLEMPVKLIFFKKIWSWEENAKTKTPPNDGEFPVVKAGTTIVRAKGGL